MYKTLVDCEVVMPMCISFTRYNLNKLNTTLFGGTLILGTMQVQTALVLLSYHHPPPHTLVNGTATYLKLST